MPQCFLFFFEGPREFTFSMVTLHQDINTKFLHLLGAFAENISRKGSVKTLVVYY